jgi:hypothetical protein
MHDREIMSDRLANPFFSPSPPVLGRTRVRARPWPVAPYFFRCDPSISFACSPLGKFFVNEGTKRPHLRLPSATSGTCLGEG